MPPGTHAREVTYVSVEPFHLFRYIGEESFRFNTRETDDGQRFQKVIGSVVGKRPYLQGADRPKYDASVGKGQGSMDAKPEKEETPFQRFQKALRHIVSVPKADIDMREAEWRKERKAKEENS